MAVVLIGWPLPELDDEGSSLSFQQCAHAMTCLRREQDRVAARERWAHCCGSRAGDAPWSDRELKARSLVLVWFRQERREGQQATGIAMVGGRYGAPGMVDMPLDRAYVDGATYQQPPPARVDGPHARQHSLEQPRQLRLEGAVSMQVHNAVLLGRMHAIFDARDHVEIARARRLARE